MQDQIAQAMWDSYQDVVHNGGEPLEALED